ncbi:MAG TPA: protein kinase [Vicinamibacterales bacterium]
MTSSFGDLSDTTIRRYGITRLIARGGMGEVYLARDAVLGRDLALKILRQDLTRDPNRLERFILEARAASALHHPHLIAIYDIGESAPKRNGVPVGPPVLFIAMELVTGETLRAAISSRRLGLDRTVAYLAQVADALAAAHAAGVTHRDLKPENLMIAEGGYAKVLDFGVAKLRDNLFRKDGASHETSDTRGVVTGTVGYMSPEQAQGQSTDQRTDVFSFGCVLYEAITGRRAFDGTSAFTILRKIVDEQPPPLSTFAAAAPRELESIVSRCLAKAPGDRYASMSDVAADLRRVDLSPDRRAKVEPAPPKARRDEKLTAASARVEKPATASPRVEKPAAASARVEKPAAASARVEKLATASPRVEKPAATSPRDEKLAAASARNGKLAAATARDGIFAAASPRDGIFAAASPPDAKRAPASRRSGILAAVSRRAGILAVAVGLTALALAIVMIVRGLPRVGGSAAPPRMTIERLTTSGTAIDSALSPDGRYLASVDSIGGMQGLKVRQLGEDRNVVLVPPAQVGYWGIAFSPDGSRVYYAIKSAKEPGGRLYAVNVLGGTPPKPVLDGIDSAISFSPDGRRFAFYRANHPERGSTALVHAGIDGTDARVVTVTRAPEFFVPAFFAAPSWSPDGSRIAAAIHSSTSGDAVLATVDVSSGERQAFATRFQDVTFTAWLRDGSGILFVANQSDGVREFPRKVWLQPFPNGTPHRVTPDLVEYRNISLRADGSAFASVGLDAAYTLWRVPLSGGVPERLSSERYDGLLGVAPLKDGRLVVTTGERGNAQLAMLDRAGTGRQILTKDGVNTWPAVTPDGASIAFVSNRDGQTGIWVMKADGSEPRLLTHLPGPTWLSVTPDGRFVVCASLDQTNPSTWRIPIQGGQPAIIAPGMDRPAVSPNGRMLAGINMGANGVLMLVTMPMDGSAPLRSHGTIAPATANGVMEWTADGQGILFSTVERANVWMQRLDGGAPTRVTNLTDLAIVRGRRTPDGRSLILARGTAQTDAYLVSRFK